MTWMQEHGKMMRSDFKLDFDTKTEHWFVIKTKDELTKNHKNIEEIVSGLMSENKDDKMCPVRSFRMYVDHLHPDNEYFWQTPLTKISPLKPNIWFSHQHMGKNTLGKFMSEVSLNCHLSKMYTNHSIRVTGITVLTRMRFSPSEIMSVSGHKSVQSLTNYQCTQPKQKVTMGKVLYQSMTKEEEEIILPGNSVLQNKSLPEIGYLTEASALVSKEHNRNVTSENAIIPFEPNFEQDVPDFDLLQVLSEFENTKDV